MRHLVVHVFKVETHSPRKITTPVPVWVGFILLILWSLHLASLLPCVVAPRDFIRPDKARCFPVHHCNLWLVCVERHCTLWGRIGRRARAVRTPCE